MKHFHRTTLGPAEALALADGFFRDLGLRPGVSEARVRAFAGTLGAVTVTARMEGGHATFLEVHTDQVGESRLDKNVKKYFNAVHREADPRHRIEAGY